MNRLAALTVAALAVSATAQALAAPRAAGGASPANQSLINSTTTTQLAGLVSTAPLATFFTAALPGFSAAADRQVTVNRGSVPASKALRVIVRGLDPANPSIKMYEFPVAQASLNVAIDTNGQCGASKFADVSSASGVTGVNIERKSLYSIEIYEKAAVPDSYQSVPAPPMARKDGGMTAARGSGLRGWDPATPDHGKTWAAWSPGIAPTCMPGGEPWPEPEPMGALL